MQVSTTMELIEPTDQTISLRAGAAAEIKQALPGYMAAAPGLAGDVRYYFLRWFAEFGEQGPAEASIVWYVIKDDCVVQRGDDEYDEVLRHFWTEWEGLEHTHGA